MKCKANKQKYQMSKSPKSKKNFSAAKLCFINNKKNTNDSINYINKFLRY